MYSYLILRHEVHNSTLWDYFYFDSCGPFRLCLVVSLVYWSFTVTCVFVSECRSKAYLCCSRGLIQFFMHVFLLTLLSLLTFFV